MKTCTIDGCEKPLKARGFCAAHWSRWRRHGDPLAGRTPDGALPAFVDAVLDGTAPVEPNGCILWPYATSSGYPLIHDDELGTVRVGAVILTRTVGPKPTTSHMVGHAPHDVCGSTRCVAPAHLSWQTYEEQAQNRLVDGTATRPDITDEMVADAVARVRAGESRRSVADDLGVSKIAIHNWLHGRFRKAATKEVGADA